jgi:hypothetical protein
LEALYIGGNKIKKLENLPRNLEELCILGNQIREIQNLPDKLTRIYIPENSLLPYTSPFTRETMAPEEIQRGRWKQTRDEQWVLRAVCVLQQRFRAWYYAPLRTYKRFARGIRSRPEINDSQ